MPVLGLAVLAALGAAACYAVAAAVQQREAERVPAGRLAAPSLLWQLAHRPWWVAAVGAMAIAASLHLWALAHAPLLVVQPIGVTGLVYAVVLAALLGSRRVARGEILAAVTVCVGLVGLLSVLPQQPGTPAPLPGGVVLVMAGAPAALAALAVAAARRVPGTSRVGRTGRTVVLACAAAVALGTTSALARSLLSQLSRVGPAAVLSWPTLIVVALAVLGFWLAQCAYQAGNLGAAFAVITVIDPVTAGIWGVGVLHEPLPFSTLGVATLAASATLIVTGIGVLAASRAAPATPATGGATPVPGLSWATTSGPASGGDGGLAADEPAPRARGPLRVLIGTDTYPPDVNGAAYFTRRLAAGLAARGHQVHLLCPARTRRDIREIDAPEVDDGEVGDGVVLHRVGSVRILVHPTFRVALPWAARRAAARAMAEINPDVVHVQGHFTIGRSVIRQARRAGIPVAATNHFMPENLLPYTHLPPSISRPVHALAWADFARVFNRADAITTPTPLAAHLLEGTGLHRAVQPISCGIDLARFTPHPDRADALTHFGLPLLPTVLFIGRLDAEKHLPELITALAHTRATIEAQLVLVGTGSQHAALAEQAHRLGVAEHVHFLGLLPDEQIPLAHRCGDVFCMPGVAELQSIATLEAMATGTPIIAADALALPHLVTPGVNGYLYPPGDIDTLTAHLVGLLTEPATAHAMGAASRALALAHDHSDSLRHFETLYHRILRPGQENQLHPAAPGPAGPTLAAARQGATTP